MDFAIHDTTMDTLDMNHRTQEVMMKKWFILALALLTIPAYGTEYQPHTTTQSNNHGGILSIGTLSILPGNQSGNRGGHQGGSQGGNQGD